MNEMFFPIKSTQDLICEHCGEIIPTGTYFDTYRNKNYHIECLWDKLVNNQESNTYIEAEGYFYSLQKYIGDWPGNGLDVEEDYKTDLELVKANNRFLKRQPLDNMLNETIEYYMRSYEII